MEMMMVMNKKEKAEMQRLRDDLALARAMRWPDYPKPSTVTREWINANKQGDESGGWRSHVARGWFYNAYLGSHSPHTPTYGCSNGMTHSKTGNTATTQEMGQMYATRLEALQALRIDLTEQCAKVLAAVDKQIAEESA